MCRSTTRARWSFPADIILPPIIRRLIRSTTTPMRLARPWQPAWSGAPRWARCGAAAATPRITAAARPISISTETQTSPMSIGPGMRRLSCPPRNGGPTSSRGKSEARPGRRRREWDTQAARDMQARQQVRHVHRRRRSPPAVRGLRGFLARLPLVRLLLLARVRAAAALSAGLLQDTRPIWIVRAAPQVVARCRAEA